MSELTLAPEKVAQAIRTEVANRRTLYQERDKVMHQLRRYRLMRHRPYVPKAYAARLGGERAAKLPIMYRLVQTAVTTASKRFPTVGADALNASDKRAAEDFGKACSLLLQTIEQRSRVPFLYGGFWNLFGDGLWVTKTTPGAWHGYPVQGEQEPAADYNLRVARFLAEHPLPAYVRNVDPLTFWPPLDEYGEGPAVESAWRSSERVFQTLGLRPLGVNGDFMPADPDTIPDSKPYPDTELPAGMPSMMQVDELWTRDGCAIVIGGGRGLSAGKVFLRENTMGELPYEWGFCDPTGVEDPTNVGMSVAFPLYYIVPLLDTMVGLMAAWSTLAAPTPYTTSKPGPGVPVQKEVAVRDIPLGKMIQLPTGTDIGILTPPPVGREVTDFAQFLIDAAERGGLPSIVSGGGVGSRLPALTFQATVEAGTDRLRPAIQSAERVIAGTLRKFTNVIARYDTPVRVNGFEFSLQGDKIGKGWAVIRPTEAAKGRRINCSLAVDSTQDTIAKGTHAQFMVNAQLWDIEKGMRFSGVENPEEMKQRIAADVIYRASLSPLAQAVIEGNPEVQKLLEAQTARAQAQQAPTAAGGGAPAGPGRNRQGVPPGRGGGRRGAPTQRPRGNRQGPQGQAFGRT